jgi:hypothetical protein
MNGDFEVNDDEMHDVEWGDPKLMGFCPVCNTMPCKAENEHWGVCPICHRNDGYVNLVNDRGTGASHYMVCETHKTCWAFGANLLSSWMDETPEEREASRKKLEQYRRVKPFHGFIDFAADDRNQQEFDSETAEAIEPDTSDDCGWGDHRIIGEVWIPGEYYDLEDAMGVETRTIYCHCPLCGDDGSIYGGNLWGTSVCCWGFDREIERGFQRVIAEHIKAGQRVDEVYEHISGLLGRESRRVKVGTVGEYVEWIRDLVIPGRWPERVYPRYQKYLEDGVTGTWAEFFKPQDEQ